MLDPGPFLVCRLGGLSRKAGLSRIALAYAVLAEVAAATGTASRIYPTTFNGCLATTTASSLTLAEGGFSGLQSSTTWPPCPPTLPLVIPPAR